MTVFRFTTLDSVPDSSLVSANLKSIAMMDGFRSQMTCSTPDRSLSFERLCASLLPSSDAQSTILLISSDHDYTLPPQDALAAITELSPLEDSEASPPHSGHDVIDFHYALIISFPLLEGHTEATFSIIPDVDELALPGETLSTAETRRYLYALHLAREFCALDNRTQLLTWLENPADNVHANPYDALLRTCGFRPVLSAVQGSIDISDAEEKWLDGDVDKHELDSDTSGGFLEFMYCADEVPSELLDQVAELYAVADEDEPRRDYQGEIQQWDAHRLREVAAHAQSSGTVTHFGLLLRRRPHSAPTVVALSVISQSAGSNPEVAEQNVTVTARHSRGRGLGRRVKILLLRELAQRLPQLQRIYTSCETSNAAMLQINASLDMRPISTATAYQLGG